jgi:predicted transcriptional regulator
MHQCSATQANLTELTTLIVASFVVNNVVAARKILALISPIHSAPAATAAARARTLGRDPIVPIRQSTTPDDLICLEDGHRLRSLRRYIQRKYALSPEAYRARWNLPPDYPMVAPGYSALRSKIARRGRGPEPAEEAMPKRPAPFPKEPG